METHAKLNDLEHPQAQISTQNYRFILNNDQQNQHSCKDDILKVTTPLSFILGQLIYLQQSIYKMHCSSIASNWFHQILHVLIVHLFKLVGGNIFFREV